MSIEQRAKDMGVLHIVKENIKLKKKIEKLEKEIQNMNKWEIKWKIALENKKLKEELRWITWKRY